MGGHAMGSGEPVGAQKPGGTGMHEAGEKMPVSLDDVPAWQGTGSAAPLRQK